MVNKFVSLRQGKGEVLPFAINTTSVEEFSLFWPAAIRMVTWKMSSFYATKLPTTGTTSEKKLCDAVISNNFNEFCELLRSKKAQLSLSKAFLTTLLLAACERGHLGIVSELLRHRSVDVNLPDLHRTTP